MSENYVLYKPFGMLSQLSTNDPKERKKSFLGSLYKFPQGIMPVGRLDEKSEGLLLMTTDGKQSDRINRSGVEKEYYAQLDGLITDSALEKMRKGVDIGLKGGLYRTQPCDAEIVRDTPALPPPDSSLRIDRHRPSSWIKVVLREGKFRQVRKMTAAVGFPTLRLVRVRIGVIKLDGLSPGEVRPVDSIVIEKL